jgi:hypothetical protein
MQNGPVFANGAAKGTGKPFNPNPSYVPNGYPSTYYYGGKVSCLSFYFLRIYINKYMPIT